MLRTLIYDCMYYTPEYIKHTTHNVPVHVKLSVQSSFFFEVQLTYVWIYTWMYVTIKKATFPTIMHTRYCCALYRRVLLLSFVVITACGQSLHYLKYSLDSENPHVCLSTYHMYIWHDLKLPLQECAIPVLCTSALYVCRLLCECSRWYIWHIATWSLVLYDRYNAIY